MNNKINKNDFGVLGEEFQYKVVKRLIENREFFLDVIESLDTKVFTNAYLKRIADIIKEYFASKNTIPTYKALEWELKSDSKSELDFDIMRETFQRLKNTTEENIVDSEELAIEIIKRLDTKRILDNAKTSINNGYTDEKITRIVEQLQTVTGKYSDSESFDMVGFLESDYNGKEDIKIPTGIVELDKCMNGGLKKSTLGLLIAGSGMGKTTLGAIFCCNALGIGFKVLHIFFEDTQEEMALKYYAHLTNRNVNEMSDKSIRKAETQNIYNLIPREKWNNLRLTQMVNGETTVEDIKRLVRKLENNEGFKPDIIFIDYFSCLRTTNDERLRAQNSWEMETRTIRKIEAFAKQSDIAIWVAEQSNRNGNKLSTASDKNANIQGSFQKTQPASAVLYLDRTGCEMNYAKLSLTKMRGGIIKDWDNVYLNNGTVQLDMSEVISTDAVIAELEQNDFVLK